jgi:putative spermidine/putrescine transport system ATP-binding protein
VELKELQREVGITFVFVTHDQEEALTMSDRIAVFDQGRIEQLGTPSEVYEQPATPFVAGFVGTSNLLRDAAARSVLGQEGTFSVRPEKIRIVEVSAAAGPDEHSVVGTVREVEYLGSLTRFHVELEVGGTLLALQQNLTLTSTAAAELRGRQVRLVWEREHEFRVADAT